MDKMKYLRLLLIVTATMPLWNLGHPLWEVDDARYAEVPREMVETGDWLTPHLNYIDYVQKPPLIYWMTAVSYKAFGVSESASRIPLVFLALLGLLGTAWLGSWLFSREVGIWAAIILGSCAEFSLLTHLQTPDLALTVFLLWAGALILRALRHPANSGWAGPAAGLAMGLAFLSKGLVAWIFPGVWTCALLVLFPELRRGVKLSAWLGALIAAILVVGPWLWAMSSLHPRFLYHFFIEQHFLRYLRPTYDRPGPWYYFIGVDAAGLLPWTPVVFASLGLAAARWKRSNAGERQLLLWVGIVLLFFSASRSKLATYILPLFPQQCLIAAYLIHKLAAGEQRLPWLDRLHQTLGILMWIAIPVALLFALRLHSSGYPISRNLIVLGSFLLIVLGAGWIYPKLLPWAAFFMTGIFLIAANQAEPWLSVRRLGGDIRSQCATQDPLITYNLYLHGIPFYTGRRVDQVVNWLGEMDYGKGEPRFQDRFGDDDTIRRLGRSGRKACVVLPKTEEAFFSNLLPPGYERIQIARGPWVLMILGRD